MKTLLIAISVLNLVAVAYLLQRTIGVEQKLDDVVRLVESMPANDVELTPSPGGNDSSSRREPDLNFEQLSPQPPAPGSATHDKTTLDIGADIDATTIDFVSTPHRDVIDIGPDISVEDDENLQVPNAKVVDIGPDIDVEDEF